MRHIIITIMVLSATLLASGVVLAHSDTQGTNPMETMMRQMMGDSAFNTMEDMEHQMMGEENHAQMEELMNKMLAGNLSQNDQQAMTRLMQDTMAGPGAMTMMMRMMMPPMMQNTGFVFGIPFHWSYWVTIVLFWIVLLLAIAALIRWLTRKPNA